MKIKNTRELRKRADWHADQGHVKQGTYGDGKANGKVTFEACAVGCLSTPHTKSALRAFIKEHTEYLEGTNEEPYFSLDDADQRALLQREFGMCKPLTRLAEGFFEAQLTHGAAIKFVREFAHALVEGANIEPAHCRNWAARSLNLDEHTTSSWKRWGNIAYEVISRAVWARAGVGTNAIVDRRKITNANRESVAADTEAFLGWLRGMRAA